MSHEHILTIDGREVAVPAGATILDAARRLGIPIPTLCHAEGLPPGTSCMVCVVEIEGVHRLVPSCAYPAHSGLAVRTDTPAVQDARRAAVELLMSEHVGDCEGPCERVCPASIRIPAVIRKLAAGDRAGAAAIYAATSTQPGIPCRECNGRCEKPCRRRQIDAAVSIRSLMLYAAGALDAAPKGRPHPKRFNCTIGRLSDEEKETVLAQASRASRVAPADAEGGFTAEEAAAESQRCLHCDCRKADDCRLRDAVERLDAQARRYAERGRHPIEILNHPNGLVFEPGKCIKCGLCIRKAATFADIPGLTFVQRGYRARVSPPTGETFVSALGEHAADIAAVCPTGALVIEQDAQKPPTGPTHG